MSIATWEFESPPLHLFAEIAQLVEHNLAKVGVASSSLVFRSISDGIPAIGLPSFFFFAQQHCLIPPYLLMNIYVRYFDHEALFHTSEEVIDFLRNLNDFNMTPEIINMIQDYGRNNMPYAKRCHVRPGTYFLLIKSTAENLSEFKANRRTNDDPTTPDKKGKELRYEQLAEEKEGWYRCTMKFKRVTLIPGTEKNHYQDTLFSAYVHGKSGNDCYNRILQHLRNRQDIDPRSQFPSPRGMNFTFEFVGDDVKID